MSYHASLEQIEQKYQYRFPDIFRQLWRDGMMDWLKGWNAPWTNERNWYTEIYPTLKDNPPLLLHTGGYDFELLTLEAILDFQTKSQDENTHRFMPFARTGAGEHYAFDLDLDHHAQTPIVLLSSSHDSLLFLSKNFEDFILRMMLTRVADIVEDDIDDDFSGDFEQFRTGILADLKTIQKYLKPEYASLLTQIYNRPVKKECELLSLEEFHALITRHFEFDFLDQEIKLNT